MAHRSDQDLILTTHNTARFFTENRPISWVVLIFVLIWGIYGYVHMPKRKDPDIPVQVAAAICQWPGVSAEKIEQLVTRKIEEKIAENSKIHEPDRMKFGIQSLTLPGVAIVNVQLTESERVDVKKEFADINLKLKDLNKDLPDGAGPIQFLSDYGDTAALMLTVASPKANELAISVLARTIRQAIEQIRSQVPPDRSDPRVTLVAAFPQSINPQLLVRRRDLFAQYVVKQNLGRDVRPIEGPGFVGFDIATTADDAAILAVKDQWVRERLGSGGFHPDAWKATVIRDPKDTEARMIQVAGDKYSYRELDDFTDLIQRTLQTVPQVSKVLRNGVLPEWIFLEYSQERLASYGIQLSQLKNLLAARNITVPGGTLEIEGQNVLIEPSGELHSEREIGDVLATTSSSGSPLYLRDLVDIARGYQNPPTFLNYFTWRDSQGHWQRSHAVTLAVMMRVGGQIDQFGEAVDKALAELKARLPEDLTVARTSDQPRQVREKTDLFMSALYEAIVLVVLVALIGFWEWRSALLMGLAIPITLAMTFGMMHLLGIDLQQVSIASLIIALGLLVDDPVVAGDAIKRDLALGHPPLVSAWLGPTKLARAIMYATITNIVAYLPLLLIGGDRGKFLFSLPIVIACSLVASRIASMTFIPLLGYYLLRPNRHPEPSIEERRTRGFSGRYYAVGRFSIRHRWMVLALSFVFLGLGGLFAKQLKTAFFPMDLQYLFFVDVWLPNEAPLSATNATAARAEEVIRQVVEQYGKAHPGKDGKPRDVLKSITTFVGGGGPRFWFSLSPELQQLNYAQLVIEVEDSHDTNHLVAPLQHALSAEVPRAILDVRQLETNPVGLPIQIFVSSRADLDASRAGNDIPTHRALAEQVKEILRSVPEAARVRADWDNEVFDVGLQIDPDRANMAGVSNLDVANSASAGILGHQVAVLREGRKQIPVVARLRMEERAQLSDLQNLYVYASQTAEKVPLMMFSSIDYKMRTEKIKRRDHFRTITVQAFPAGGALASQVINAALPRIEELQKTLPPGYKIEIGGEAAHQAKGFAELKVVLLVSIAAIFVALVIQFNNAVKPLLVFAAVPYGAVGALGGLLLMGAPFGFIAFLGIASLVGVIISHVIVLFDFIEDRREKGEPLQDALLDSGILRLRPVLITVGATVTALIPLSMHGGPLWEPLCYTQIGGLLVATFIELLLVKVLYAIFVLDLKFVKWETTDGLGGDGHLSDRQSGSLAPHAQAQTAMPV